MTDNNPQHRPTNQQDELDRELDAGLTTFAAVEPRTGLEERILANLRAEQTHASNLSWWRWPAIAALLAIIVLAVSVAWKAKRPMPNIVARPPAPHESVEHARTQAPNHPRLKPVIHQATTVVSAPKLDQFPSPQPLSEQEKILAHYVATYPQHAALIAQARTDELRRDSLEESDDAAHENSKQRDK
jgi:hypothetical protein